MSDVQNMIERRRIMSALVLAMENIETVVRLCATTPGDRDAVVAALAKEFSWNAIEARAVGEMQLLRLRPQQVETLRMSVGGSLH
mgnify:FL=1